jgi:hypothetical protein
MAHTFLIFRNFLGGCADVIPFLFRRGAIAWGGVATHCVGWWMLVARKKNFRLEIKNRRKKKLGQFVDGLLDQKF